MGVSSLVAKLVTLRYHVVTAAQNNFGKVTSLLAEINRAYNKTAPLQ